METAIDIISAIKDRKSIRAFADKTIEKEKIHQLFEAARWSASSFNEQPWRFIYATKEHETQYNNILSTINEFNQSWAKNVPMLMVVVAKTEFSMNGKTNRHAWYDTGAAMANFATQATIAGLFIHQMAGFSAEKAKETLNIPDGFEAVAAVAVGYQGDAAQLNETLRSKENAPRSRKELNEIVFEGQWH